MVLNALILLCGKQNSKQIGRESKDDKVGYMSAKSHGKGRVLLTVEGGKCQGRRVFIGETPATFISN